MRIVAISGSLRAASSNGALVDAAARLGPPELGISVFGGLGELPHFNPDLDDSPQMPPAAARFRQLVGTAAGLIISSPEYAHGIPGSLKNALDWLVGDQHFDGMPIALWSSSPRAVHVQAQLREVLTTITAQIIEEACITVPLGQAPHADRIVADPNVAGTLRLALRNLSESTALRRRWSERTG